MIIFDQVTKKFPLGNIALDKANFTIEKNDFVFLVGPSGAGKTTILKLILKELIPSSGSIVIDDEDINNLTANKIPNLRKKFGVVFQDFKVLYDKNVFENVALTCQVENYNFKQLKEKTIETLRLVNLEEKKYLFPIQLSAGELQRVAIARAIVTNRPYLLADEPTGNLDPKTSWEIIKIFKKFENKKTIIIATHNSDIVNSLEKRVITLKNGKIIKDKRKGGYQL